MELKNPTILMKNPPQTFRDAIQATRNNAAVAAWERARVASELRRISAKQGHLRAAQSFSQLKLRAIQRVAMLQPEKVRISIDSTYQTGLVSVRFDGHGCFHLPANSPITRPSKGV
ncbi:MAG: hypothetical protein SFX18_12500 [Pirellulales bacterium]|nr:hypothetical protein [Pirellulales bacterium]